MLQARHHEIRVDATLEAIARVRVDAELASGLRDIERVPERRLDQHVGGFGRAAGFLTAHDAGERFHRLFVSDDTDRLVELIGSAVEREQALAFAAAPDGEIAVHFCGVEHVQWTPAVEGHEVGDVDQRIDGAQPDRDEALLQPFGGGAVLHATHEAQRKAGAQLGLFDLHRDRAGECALHGLRRGIDELAHVGGRKVARDAVHTGAVRAIGREIDLDDRIVELRPFHVALADRRVGRQVDDALVVVGQFHLGFRDEHAAAFDAANGANAERDLLARNVGAGRREHAVHAGARVRRAAHDLDRIAGAGVDDADAQPVRVRMLLRLDHPGDGEGAKRLRLVLDVLHLEPNHRELAGERVERLVGGEMLFEPRQRELHGLAPRTVAMRPVEV